MKNPKGISKLLHIIILVCFFLPFLKSCDMSFLKEPMNLQDSIALQESSQALDSLLSEEAADSSYRALPDTAEVVVKKKSLADRIIGTLLLPGGDYSGACLVLTSYTNAKLALTILPAYLLLILTTVLVFRKRSRPERLFVLSLITAFLLFAFVLLHFSDVMYGSWLAIFFTLLNCFLLYLYKRSHSHHP